jgi:two-component sensor histidine kinase
LRWAHEADGRLILRWTEIGGPPAQTPTRRGFGTRVIEQMIAQLKGETRFDWRSDGLVCEIVLKA